MHRVTVPGCGILRLRCLTSQIVQLVIMYTEHNIRSIVLHDYMQVHVAVKRLIPAD